MLYMLGLFVFPALGGYFIAMDKKPNLHPLMMVLYLGGTFLCASVLVSSAEGLSLWSFLLVIAGYTCGAVIGHKRNKSG